MDVAKFHTPDELEVAYAFTDGFLFDAPGPPIRFTPAMLEQSRVDVQVAYDAVTTSIEVPAPTPTLEAYTRWVTISLRARTSIWPGCSTTLRADEFGTARIQSALTSDVIRALLGDVDLEITFSAKEGGEGLRIARRLDADEHDALLSGGVRLASGGRGLVFRVVDGNAVGLADVWAFALPEEAFEAAEESIARRAADPAAASLTQALQEFAKLGREGRPSRALHADADGYVLGADNRLEDGARYRLYLLRSLAGEIAVRSVEFDASAGLTDLGAIRWTD
jgi:hypothetical protein